MDKFFDFDENYNLSVTNTLAVSNITLLVLSYTLVKLQEYNASSLALIIQLGLALMGIIASIFLTTRVITVNIVKIIKHIKNRKRTT